jgi:SPP1 family predicted phage head-tail adaptor
MALNFSRMRQRIALQSATESTAADGQKTKTWSTYATVWGYAVPVSASEIAAADHPLMGTTWAVEMRWRSTVTEQHRMQISVHGVTRTVYITGLRDVDNLGKVLQIGGFERSDD